MGVGTMRDWRPVTEEMIDKAAALLSYRLDQGDEVRDAVTTALMAIAPMIAERYWDRAVAMERDDIAGRLETRARYRPNIPKEAQEILQQEADAIRERGASSVWAEPAQERP
jgi:hypothetical protein